VGRPSASAEVIDLVHKMSLANPRWGALQIHGELLSPRFLCLSQSLTSSTIPGEPDLEKEIPIDC
jgi:hypothetical protein